MPLVLIVLLSLTIVGVWAIYNVYYLPNAKLYSTYTQVYHEIDIEEISTLEIDTVNHNVEIIESSDNSIRITYYQKADNSNTFQQEGGKVILQMIEKAEDLDNLFYQSNKEIDKITIYLPSETNLRITFETDDGNLTINGTSFSTLTYTSTNGGVTISDSSISRMELTSKYGDISINNTSFVYVKVYEVAGDIDLSIDRPLSETSITAASTYGSLTINGEQRSIDEENYQVSENSVSVTNSESTMTISIEGTRSTISITCPEEEIEEPIEEETTEENGEGEESVETPIDEETTE